MVYIIKKRTSKPNESVDLQEEKILGIVRHIGSTEELKEKMLELAKKEGVKKVDNFGFCDWAKCFRLGDWKEVELYAELTKIL